jgi:hypothetical protein
MTFRAAFVLNETEKQQKERRRWSCRAYWTKPGSKNFYHRASSCGKIIKSDQYEMNLQFYVRPRRIFGILFDDVVAKKQTTFMA